MDIRERCPVDDVALTMLHAAAFGETPRLRPWGAQLSGHSLTWLGAFDGDRMIGFANVAWDCGLHAFLPDVVVDPDPAAGGHRPGDSGGRRPAGDRGRLRPAARRLRGRPGSVLLSAAA